MLEVLEEKKTFFFHTSKLGILPFSYRYSSKKVLITDYLTTLTVDLGVLMADV